MQELYSEYVIAFLDILGFRHRVELTKKNPSEIKKISELLHYAKEYVSYMSGELDIKARMFSDTIVITCPSAEWPRPLATVFALVAQFQFRMIERDYFLRGSITMGEHYEENEIMFGPAMVQAYETEKFANWPRVIIHPNVFKKLEHKSLGYELEFGICRNSDGLPYLDYLKGAFAMEVVSQWVKEYKEKKVLDFPAAKFFSIHQEEILKCAKPKKTRATIEILIKYHHIAKYHNMVVDEICKQLNYWTKYGKPQTNTFMDIFYKSRVFLPNSFQVDITSNFTKFWDNKCKDLLSQMESINNCKINLRDAFPTLYS